MELNEEDLKVGIEKLRPLIESMIRESPDTVMMIAMQEKIAELPDVSREALACGMFTMGMAAAIVSPEWAMAFRSISKTTELSDESAEDFIEGFPIRLEGEEDGNSLRS